MTDFLSIIIDRVGTTNVFNIIQGRLPSRDTHLQSIVDDDLIQEFLGEIERISRISNTMSEDDAALLPLDVSGELRRIGETFFLQLFPEQIQERLRNTEEGFLFLHVDYKLRSIPWELLHDGNCFLADKFYMGKNISGFWRESNRPERDRLNVLIVADPTEDLEWARLEGEGLFESLNAELSADRLDVQFLSGKRITKLKLLNAIKDRDIIHFSGHLHYSKQQQESGWLLSDNKVLRAREIEKAGFSPFLVFSNSCFSSAVGDGRESGASALEDYQGSRFSDLAGAFLKAGISNYIGTNWEIVDNRRTYDFAMSFYRAIFEEKSVGAALFEARMEARRNYPRHDLTWANYVLHGNPHIRIYRSAGRRTFDASRNQFKARKVVDVFPTPIALAYSAFVESMDSGDDARLCLTRLGRAFESTMLVVGAVIFGNHRHLNLRSEEEEFQSLSGWIERIYLCIGNIHNLNLELAPAGLLESLSLHRDPIHKLLDWTEKIAEGALSDEDYEAHQVTFQYLFDNLLSDLASLSRYRILHLMPDGETAYTLAGLKPEQGRLFPAEFRDPVLMELVARNRDRTCFFNSARRILFSLDGYMRFNPETGESAFPLPLEPALTS